MHIIEIENQSTPEVVAPHSQHWVSAHPITASLIASTALLLIGSAIVFRHSAANPPAPVITAWGGGGIDPYNTVTGSVTADQEEIVQQVQNNPPYTYVIPDLKGNTTPSSPQPTENSNDLLDFEQFMAGLGQSTAPGNTAPKEVADITNAFPPTSLFIAPTPKTDRTPLQQALYNYGNEIGSYIQSYEQQHPDQTQVLKNHIEDQNNPIKINAVVQMGRDLQGIGTSLLGMEDVPAQVSAAHKKLAESYQTIGKNLTLVPQAKGNDALLSAIGTYNASADVFAKDLVALVGFFSMYGVTFSAEDAGNIFTFTYSGGM